MASAGCEEGAMAASADEFRLCYNGEIRESLIMIEGNDGAFDLLACGWLTGDGEKLFALVRSTGTNRDHLLVRSGERDQRHVYNWHRIDLAALEELQTRIARLRVDRMTAATPRSAR
jgi:hypothetical protein